MSNKNKFLISKAARLWVVIFLFFLLSTLPVKSANQGTITVQANVPAGAAVCGNGVQEGGEECDLGAGNGVCPAACSALCRVNNCAPGGGGGDAFPSIQNVVVVPTKNSAKITWQANDDKGIHNVTLVYGLNVGYGSNGNVAGNYEVNLNGLVPDTTYFFKISVVDTGLQTTNYANSFKTLAEDLPPADNVPPVIANIAEVIGITNATISWDTNENADGQVKFGLNNQYNGPRSGIVIDNNLVLHRDLALLNLLPNTLYHYQVISTDAKNNSAASADRIFTTKKDDIPPPDVANLALDIGKNSFTLTWNNPNVLDFVGVNILRKIGGRSQNINDGLLVYQGAAENFVDNQVLVNIEYTYTVFSYDTSGNYSGGVLKSGKIAPPAQQEVCDNGIDDNGNGLVDCRDPACPACPPQLVEICNNGIDDNNNGAADCEDNACKNLPICLPAPPLLPPPPGGGGIGAELCDNGLDDDVDGKVDCADADCVNFLLCINAPKQPVEPIPPAPVPSIPIFAHVSLDSLSFLGGNRQVKLKPQGGVIASLAGSNFTVAIPKKILISPPVEMFLEVEGGSKHQFVYNPVADTYFSDIVFPSAGPHQSYVAIDYGNNQVDSVEFNLVGITLGEIKDKDGLHLDGVQVVLLDENKQQVNTGLWGQVNPMVTNQNGFYGWVVPNGLYFIYAKKDGYFERRIPFVVTNNVVNKSFELLPKIAPLKIDLKGPVVQNIQNIAKSLGEQAAVIGQETVDVISDLSNDPEVKKQAGQVVAPTAVGVVAIGTISLVSWTELLSLLRFLFLQPLLLLGWKKREKWGLVYNSLNKLPIDLAVVRLLETKTGRIVQSKVTDAKGRYVLSAKPGAYRIVVNKGGFVFPSAILKDFKDDGRNVDIYHGESVEVTENDSTISPNIPLDMVGVPTVPKRLVWQKVIRRVQTFISWLGLIVTAVSLYLSPKWYVLVLLILHLFLFFVFRRLATPVKPKGWGIAYDTYSRKPIARVIARLFDNQFNKLVATQITDSKGRYYFLAGENKYYVTYSHENYEEYKTAEISTIGKDGLVAPTVALKKIEEK